MIKKKSIDNQLHDKVYSNINPINWKFILIGIILFAVGFLVNFPIRRTIINFSSRKLANFKACPINYERLELGRFLQWAKFKGPIISGSCYGQSSSNFLRLESLNISLETITMNPPGVKLHLKLKKNKTNLNIYPILSYPKMGLQIKDSVIDGDIVKNLTGDMFKLLGQIKINSDLIFQKNNLNSGSISIVSKNLSIPTQNIMNFLVPHLNIRDLNIKANIKGTNNIHFSSLKLGSETSPIMASFKGSIKLNSQNIRRSNLDLKGKIKFSAEFLKKFAILNIFISGKQKDSNGFYSLSLKGPMGQPKMKLD
ncbi:MAG: type II secretion system protein GspN [Epsilonproteobacteria bacterium]|nr:MAG: type II secretion system protein GspN [Campylobacterota bacterium]RLA67353.1 MAG: type II secretion system protein GspN [Campylobacterota bacterium]